MTKTTEEILLWQSHYLTSLIGGIFGILQSQDVPEEIIEEIKLISRSYADKLAKDTLTELPNKE